MNINQAKSIPLADFLSRLGYEPSFTKRGQLWYCSPLRSEKEPSFKLNPERNSWIDFGDNRKGDILDFIQAHDHLGSIPEALGRIREIMGEGFTPSVKLTSPSPPPEPSPLTLDRIGPVRSEALKAYLRARGIAPQLAAHFVQEAHYRCDARPYFALAFPNRSGGFELRNPHFKGTLGTKDISVLPGNTDTVAVFEGFFDYLTAIELAGSPPSNSVIVLNSVSFKDKAIDLLKTMNAKQVDLYRDNDAAGESLLAYFREQLPNMDIKDMAPAYAKHNDLNAKHMSNSIYRHEMA